MARAKTFNDLLLEFPPFDVIARLQKHGGMGRVARLLGVSRRTVFRLSNLFEWDDVPYGVVSKCFELLGASPTRLSDLREAKQKAATCFRPYPWLKNQAWNNFCKKADKVLTKRK